MDQYTTGNKALTFGNVNKNSQLTARLAHDDTVILNKVGLNKNENIAPLGKNKASTLGRSSQNPVFVASGIKAFFSSVTNSSLSNTSKGASTEFTDMSQTSTVRKLVVHHDSAPDHITQVDGASRPEKFQPLPEIVPTAPLHTIHEALSSLSIQLPTSGETSQPATTVDREQHRDTAVDNAVDLAVVDRISDSELVKHTDTQQALSEPPKLYTHEHANDHQVDEPQVSASQVDSELNVSSDEEEYSNWQMTLARPADYSQTNHESPDNDSFCQSQYYVDGNLQDNAQWPLDAYVTRSLNGPGQGPFWDFDDYIHFIDYEQDDYSSDRRYGDPTGKSPNVLDLSKVVVPKVTFRSKRELAAAALWLEMTRHDEEDSNAEAEEDDELNDPTLVSEYSEEIFAYMRKVEVRRSVQQERLV